MTLEELKTRCINAGFKYAYGLFKKPTDPPHLIAICKESENFMADNKVYETLAPNQTVKATVSGIYITQAKRLRGPVVESDPKKRKALEKAAKKEEAVEKEAE